MESSDDNLEEVAIIKVLADDYGNLTLKITIQKRDREDRINLSLV